MCAHVDPAHDGQAAELARRGPVNQLRRILPAVAPPPSPTPPGAPPAEAAAAWTCSAPRPAPPVEALHGTWISWN